MECNEFYASCRSNRVTRIMIKTDPLPVRLSHLVRMCFVGSLVRGPEYSVCVQDTRSWVDDKNICTARLIPYVDQIRQSLNIAAELRSPPTASISDNGTIQGKSLPSVKFPKWTYCTASKLLVFDPWSSEAERKGKRCACGKGNLEQVPLVVIHSNGYLSDVDWHALAHRKGSSVGNCGRGKKIGYITYKDHPSDPNTIRLTCTECYQGTHYINVNERLNYSGTIQPWLDERAPNETNKAEFIQLNDARLYKPKTASALVIPPESRLKHGSVVDRLYTTQSLLNNLDEARTPLRKKAELRAIASHLRCSLEEVEQAIVEIENGYPLYGQEFSPGTIEEREYEALLAKYPDMDESEDFVVETLSKQWKNLHIESGLSGIAEQVVTLIDNLVSVKRLKELLIFKGFERGESKQETPPELVTPNVVGGDDWLPAIELYGEGLFFTLDEEILSEWEEHTLVNERTSLLANRYEKAQHNDDPIDISSRFLLLHIIAHQLILQLEIQSGYPASSMKEKIFSQASGKKRAGILVYIAVPDVSGTLGGLVELTDPKTLLPMLIRTFERASWCSLDPICSELEGQGPWLQNKAACHACSLIPEMSCITGNTLLDRSYIKGDELSGMPSIFDFVK